MSREAIVVGAGPAGLAVAACLGQAGWRTTLLEREGTVGSAWRRHYEGLRLHTVRGRSGLPGMPMPDRGRRYPGRADMVEYLESYARRFGLAPRFGCTVRSVGRIGGGWRVNHAGGTEEAAAVVLVTGLNAQPRLPRWPAQDSFPGPILHSAEYRRPDGFAGQTVIVVGLGNSGGDLAVELAGAGAQVTLSVRGPVNIVPEELFGIPITSMGLLRKALDYRLADRVVAPLLRARIGRPSDYGLADPGKGPLAQVVEDGRVPLIDHGALAAIREGRVTVAPAIERIDGRAVSFADGTVREVDAILCATGFSVDLRPLLGADCAALDEAGRPRRTGAPPAVPGLYFCGLRASPQGQLPQISLEARAIAADLAANR